METLADRILEIRKANGLSQAAFAAPLNLSQNFIWMVEKGQRDPGDRTIADICRVFKVDETWLRTGVGEMHVPKTRVEELDAIFSEALEGVSDKDKLLRAIASIPDSAFPALSEFFRTIAKEFGA